MLLHINTPSHRKQLLPSPNISINSYLLSKISHTTNTIMSSSEIPKGDAMDNDYKSRTGQSEIPVQSDDAPVEATEYTNGGDSDLQLGIYLNKQLLSRF